MKILIDIGHPAHVHYSKNFIKKTVENYNDDILVIARSKDIALELLRHEKIPFINRGRGGSTLVGKLLYMIYADYFIYKYARKFKPDLYLSFMTPYPTHVARILSKPSVVVTDTEHSIEQIRLFKKFATSIITPSCFKSKLGPSQLYIDSYLELLYLHPNYFKPDPKIKNELNISKDEKYVIIRFVSWKASHDRGYKGFTSDFKKYIVSEINKHAKVFISSEGYLPDELLKYKFPLPSHKMHHAIAYADLLYGESATMASEAALLGTPAVYHDIIGRCYTDELEKEYNAVYNYSLSELDQRKGLNKAIEIIKDNNSKSVANKKRSEILQEKIDFTSFLLSYVHDL